MLAVVLSSVLIFLPQGSEHLRVTGPTPSLLRLGSTAVIEISLIDSRSQPARIVLSEVAGLDMRVGGWHRNNSRFVINGRVSEESRYLASITIKPTLEGKFAIPGFDVVAGEQRHPVAARTIEVVRDLKGQDRSYLDVRLSATKVYLNEPIRVFIDYGVDNRLTLSQKNIRSGESYYEVQLQAPWLDDMMGTVNLDSEVEPAKPLNLVLNQHVQRVDYEEDHHRGDRRFHRFRLIKSFMPTVVGTIQLVPVTLKFESEIDQGRRDIFGRRAGARTESFFNYSEPFEVVVVPLPKEGQPTNFSKAVGRFTLDASVDRREVRVGNSIKLTVRIEGQGNTEFLEIPNLDGLEGFHLLGSKTDRELDRVSVTYDLTPLREDVVGLPRIDWNYFDSNPGVERYVSLSTEPIPLRVLPIAEGKSLLALPGEETRPVVPGVDDIFDMKASDALLLPLPVLPNRAVVIAMLASPWLACGLIALWFASRRKRVGDVLGRRARGAMRKFRCALAASVEPTDALIAYLAARMGLPEAAVIGPDLAACLEQAGVEERLAAEVAAAAESGVAARYGGSAVLDRAQAEDLAGKLEAIEIRRSRVVATLAGLLLMLSLSASAVAQGLEVSDVTVAESAYRRGDYAVAAENFTKALDVPGADRRLAYNLGNALYRQGEFAPALAAYERARLAMPRDRELLANIALVRHLLELGSAEGEPFFEAVADLRDALTRSELLWITFAANLLAAILLIFTRSYLRWAGFLVLLAALLCTAEVTLLAPARAPLGIITAERALVYAEPRESADLQEVLTLRAGVRVDVLARAPVWVKIQVGERSGYLRSELLQVIE